jgi:hypothetical protein
MPKREKTHYNMDTIDEEGAQINLIYGERSNGKSYQLKHKKAVLQYLFGGNRYICTYKEKEKIIKSCVEKGSKFMLIRRWREEISSELVEKYFDDVDIMKLTDNKYNCITMFKKTLYLSIYDLETGKTHRGAKIGYVVALSTEQKYAGGSYLDVTDMIFEEFMSRDMYLANEPAKLMNLFSTVDRKRGFVKLWLVGNTISRVCPYLVDWDLLDDIRKQKQGEIITKWIPTGETDDEGFDIEVKIAIEYCKSTGNSSYIIGKHKDMLNKGEWQSDPQPHLPKSKKDYKILYRIMFVYKSFNFIAEFLQDNETKNVCWFVFPTNKNPRDDIIVFSDIIKVSDYWQRDIYNPTFRNPKLRDLLQTFRESNIFYATDMCGTDFKQVIDFTIKK